MSFTLDKVVPWGRSFEEYVAMFALSDKDLEKRILGCSDGPSSFNAILTAKGGKVVSIDPIYKFSEDKIRECINETYPVVMEQTRKNAHEFVWRHIHSVEELGRVRLAAMEEFLADYPAGLEQRRYLEASLPNLPFNDSEFDLALCSHYLFLYSDHLSEDFHVKSIKELCRIANEVRIFPLLELGAKISRHFIPVLIRLKKDGFIIDIKTVPYEFQKGGNQMMKITSF